MNHLYSLVFALLALTSSHLSSAQMVNPANATTPVSCDGTAFFILHDSYGPPFWSWHWEDADSTLIAGADSMLLNLCPGNYSLVLDSLGIPVMYEWFTIGDPCSNFTATSSVTNCTPGSCDGVIAVTPVNGSGPYTYSCSGSSVGPVFGLNNLCADLYTVTCVDMTGCMTTTTALVTDSSTIHPGLGTNYSVGGCTGTAVTNATGGSGTYYYLWSTGETSSSIDSLCAGNYWVTITDSINSADTITVHFTISDVCANFQLYSSSVVNTNTTNCNGTAHAASSGGFGVIHYNWSTGATTANISNLCAGTYFVNITDYLGCSLTDTVIVLDSLFISPNVTTTNALNGNCTGTASAAPTGGTAPYSFQWSNGDTGSTADSLCAGSYSVLITDANGDSTTANFTISNPCSNLIVFVSTTQTIPGNCVGIISAVPNMSNYTYTWSNGGNSTTLYNLCAGVYTVTFSFPNGCSITESIAIADSLPDSPLSAGLTSTDDLTGNCTGSATALPSGGFAPYSFYWSTGETTSSIDNLCAGIYSVTIWDATNIDTLHLSFIIADSSTTYGNPYPNLPINDSIYSDLVTNCVIDYSAIDSASLYQAVYDPINQNLFVTWAVYSPTDTVYIQDTLSWTGGPGYYSLTISVYCPNKSGNDFFKVNGVIYFDGTTAWLPTLGINEQLLDQVTIFPNPFTNSISVDNTDGAVRSLKLVDLNGRILSEMNNLNSGLVELNQLETISSGTYLLILSGANTSKTFKVIK